MPPKSTRAYLKSLLGIKFSKNRARTTPESSISSLTTTLAGPDDGTTTSSDGGSPSAFTTVHTAQNVLGRAATTHRENDSGKDVAIASPSADFEACRLSESSTAYLSGVLSPGSAQASPQLPESQKVCLGLTPQRSTDSVTTTTTTIVTSTPTPKTDATASTPPSFFSNANQFTLGTFNYIDTSKHVNYSSEPAGSTSNKGWELLLQKIAPNALYNSRDRFDPPKCDEDTRVEVIDEIMGWVRARDLPQRLLCMTGAAGAGKSALQQTIAESCAESKILASTFFFFTTDPTRNHTASLIPTIAYQLGLDNPTLRHSIGAAVDRDPVIFSKSLKTQINALVVDPVERLRESEGWAANSLPHVILIDGLDECTNEDQQAELLTTIKECILDKDTPFRVFIASRPEWAIHTALRETGYLHDVAYHIPLSHKFDATADIRRTLWRRLREIGRRSGDSRALPHLWPTEDDIEILVKSASGQFIYAATVIKYVSERRSSPVDRLRAVITWTPGEAAQRAKPFAALDLLYSNILENAKVAYEAVDTNDQDFLLILAAHLFNSQHIRSLRPTLFDQLLSLEEKTHLIIISDLRSLVTAEEAVTHGTVVKWETSPILRFYHRSFLEFMEDETRAGSLFVPKLRVTQLLTTCCLDSIRCTPEASIVAHLSTNFRVVTQTGPLAIFDYAIHPGLWQSLKYDAAEPRLYASLLAFTTDTGWKRVAKWYDAQSLNAAFLSYWSRLAASFLSQLKDREPEISAIVQTYHDIWTTKVRVQESMKTARDITRELPYFWQSPFEPDPVLTP